MVAVPTLFLLLRFTPLRSPVIYPTVCISLLVASITVLAQGVINKVEKEAANNVNNGNTPLTT